MRRFALLLVGLVVGVDGCSCDGGRSRGRPDGAPDAAIDEPVADASSGDAAPTDGGPSDVDQLARESARLALVVASLIEQNAACGFAAPPVVGNAAFTGAVGGPGTMTETIPSRPPCVLFYAVPTDVAMDCVGNTTTVAGQIAVSGTLVLSGRRTGDPADPMWIDRTDGVAFDLSVTFTDFSLGTTRVSGALEVRVAPERARAAATTLCTVRTPIATIEELSWQDATITLATEGGDVTHAVTASSLSATRGTTAAGTNALSGSITVDGYTREVNGDQLGFDPAYSPESFDAGWQCDGTLAQPISRDCWPPPALVANLARGLLRNVIFAARQLDADTTCGFSSPGAAAGAGYSPPFEEGIEGTETRSATGCAISVPDSTSVPDCVSSQTVGGSFTATGTRAITGLYTDSASDPTVPLTRTGMTWSLPSLALTGVEARSPGGGGFWFRASGTVAAEIEPIGGERASQAGVYSIRTPVIRIPSVTASALTGSLSWGPGRVDVTVSDLSLSGANGLYQNQGNSVAGTLTVDGEVVSLPVTPLEPSYTQAAFDSRYVCTPDLASVVPAGP